jgi:hypothetical protein
MSPCGLIWAAVGLMAGIAHALWLWRSTRQPGTLEGLSGVLRILGVGALFLVAALADGLVPAAVGWGLAFPSAGCVLLWRGRE